MSSIAYIDDDDDHHWSSMPILLVRRFRQGQQSCPRTILCVRRREPSPIVLASLAFLLDESAHIHSPVRGNA
jgi:hypothetical protein